MLAFFAAELSYRGKTEADFVDTPPFGGPLYDQLIYEPSECENGEGVEPDGTIVWTGGLARYVYVLAADSQSPTSTSPPRPSGASTCPGTAASRSAAATSSTGRSRSA